MGCRLRSLCDLFKHSITKCSPCSSVLSSATLRLNHQFYESDWFKPRQANYKHLRLAGYKTQMSQTQNKHGEEPKKLEKTDGSGTPFVKCHLNTHEFTGLFSEAVVKLWDLFKKNNYEIRFCGGVVRDLLQGKKPKDLDLATDATPGQMIQLFNENEIRMINEAGWGHGTVSCRINEENFEITTLRIDRVTDGRHAQVEFTTDWKLDASRRDLTINSMFLTLDGDVIDYFNGIDDLNNKYVRFVGDAQTRIQEDYLRILRYFRFFGKVADSSTSFDQNTLDIIMQNTSGLHRVSGERIQTELSLIFTGNHVVKITRAMHQCGLFDFIGLPKDADIDEFERVYNSARHLEPNFMTYVSALLNTDHDVMQYHKRTKLSNFQLSIAQFIVQYRSQDTTNCDTVDFYTNILVDFYYEKKQKNINHFFEFLKYKGDVESLDYFRNFAVPRFPVRGGSVKEVTKTKGKDVGKILNLLYERWKESKFTLTTEELLKTVDENTIFELEKHT